MGHGERVLDARHKTTERIACLQDEDGGWPASAHVGPSMTGVLLIAENVLGTLSYQDAAEAVKWMRAQVLPDGSFPGYPYSSTGSLNATARVYAGMVAAGTSENDTTVADARLWIERQGGFTKVDANGQMYLALAGLLPPEKLPDPVLFVRLIPGIDQFLAQRLFTIFSLSLNTLMPITYGLQKSGAGRTPVAKVWNGIFKSLESLGYKRYLYQHQNPDGDWMSAVEMTLWGLLTLHYLGVSKNHPRFKKALTSIEKFKQRSEHGLEVVTFLPRVWNTALMTRALILSDNDDYHHQIDKGLEFILQEQYDTPVPSDWQNPAPGAPRSGGWAFEANTPTAPDPDSTSVVLKTVGIAMKKKPDDRRLRRSANRARAFMLGMQNEDGGWPSFTWGHKTKPPGPMYTEPAPQPTNPIQAARLILAPPSEMQDPSCADETGRILMALGEFGYDTNHDTVKHAIAFLKYQRAENGVWWGRWGVNYLLTTAYIVSGLSCVGEDMSKPYCRHAIEWMVGHQNEDGGWGEAIASYLKVSNAGIGDSTAVITGRVLVGLIDAGAMQRKPLRKSINRGIQYLLDTQQTDGLWPETQAIGTVMPPDMFYTNFLYGQFAPSEALLKYDATR